jgi:hypothetical protein
MTYDTLELLLGTWHVERHIRDHHLHENGEFQGMATFRLTEPTVVQLSREAHFEETGRLRFGTYEGVARRELRLVQGNDSLVHVFFRDGRPFVNLDLRNGQWQSSHPCDADTHDIHTLVRSIDCLEERWRVIGPDTDYEATTTLTRELRSPERDIESSI